MKYDKIKELKYKNFQQILVKDVNILVRELKYSAKLTGESLLMYEFKIIAKLRKEAFSDKDIRKMVLEENLFQYKFKSSISRRLTPLVQRINLIDDNLIDMLLVDPLGDGLIINLYSIM